jgi:hypothetical protein
MRSPARSFVITVAALLAVFAAAAVAWAETCTLELKRLDPPNPQNSDYIYRACYPQSIFVQMGKDHAPMGNPEPVAAFKRIVKKEPKYQSENPFRGVVKLGSQEFAFALDVLPPPKDKEPDAEKTKKKEEKPKTGSATAKPAAKKSKTTAPDKKPAQSEPVFNRLYFDLNHNGDLTDDMPIDAESQRGPRPVGTFFQFPRVDLAVDDEGTKLEYSFFLQGQSFTQPNFSYVMVRLNAAAYREGNITLDGKKHRVVLIDFNSNGRFGDEITINTKQGDMLLVDPDPNRDSPYDVTGSDSRNYVSKLVKIDGRFYDVKISPAGDKLTLEPCSIPLGNVKNPNVGFRAVIYGDQGFLKIRGKKDAPVPVPEGQWKLLSYTIDGTDVEKPKKAEEKKPEKKADEKNEKKGSTLESLGKDLDSLIGDGSTSDNSIRLSSVSAQATDAYKAVKVVKGETVELLFGPPYKPTVTAQFYMDGDKHEMLSLGMSLVGSAGEICTDMTVNGGRPSKPKFTITDAKGKVVEQGSFEYG